MLHGMSTDARSNALFYYSFAGRDVVADVCRLLQNPQGVFVFMPDLVVLMKPVDSHKPEDWGKLEESPETADAWYVHLLVGRLALARKLAWLLPAYRYLCFERGLRHSKQHRCRWARIRL